MADALTNTAENRLLDWILGLASTAPTTPIKVALVTVAGSDTAAGTEVTGGSYARQTLTVGAASAGATSNSADIVFAGMPACTVVGWLIGLALDHWLHTTWIYLAGLLLGIAAGFVELVRTVMKSEKQG